MYENFITTYFLKNTLLIQIFILVIGVFLINRAQTLRQIFFAWAYTKILKVYTPIVVKYKQDLFAPLQDFRSLDKSLRKQGVFRILEIGVGSGANFAFYPRNAKITVVEPNPHFKKYFEENRAKFPGVNVEKVIQGEGEDLGAIENGSVDVVVTTSVLCSVHGVQQTLSEIHRVLAPGGKYFFMEHVIAAEGSWMRLSQKLACFTWKFIFNGCEITRNSELAIKKMKFVETEFKYFIAELPLYYKMFVGPHIYGTAQKVNNLDFTEL